VDSPQPPLRPSRLPGTYAAHYEREPSWRHGRLLLIVFMALDTLSGIQFAFQALLGGDVEQLLVLGTRELILAAIYFAFWIGWGWTRWLLAILNFFVGVWLLIWTLRLGGIPPLVTGLLFFSIAVDFAAAAFFAFSADLIAFITHQRQHRQVAALVIIAAILAVYLATLPALWAGYHAWRNLLIARAQAYAEQCVREIGAHWNPEEISRRAIPEFLNNNPPTELQRVCADLTANFGELREVQRPPFYCSVAIVSDPARMWIAHGFCRVPAQGTKKPCLFEVELRGNLAGGDWQVIYFYVQRDANKEAENLPPPKLTPEQEGVTQALQGASVLLGTKDVAQLAKQSQLEVSPALSASVQAEVKATSLTGQLQSVSLSSSQSQTEHRAEGELLRVNCVVEAHCEKGDYTCNVEVNRLNDGPWQLVAFSARPRALIHSHPRGHIDAEQGEADLQDVCSNAAERETRGARGAFAFQHGARFVKGVEIVRQFVEIIRQRIRPEIVEHGGHGFGELRQLLRQSQFGGVG